MGTAFYLLLPALEREEEPEKQDCVSGRSSGIDCSAHGTILLVDDEEIVRVVGEAILEELGFNVLLARDGMEGVDLFQHHQKDLCCVVMDMVMPRMNGYDAFMKMREINPEIPIAIASGFSRNRSIDELIEQGLRGFLKKPFQNRDLELFLKEVIGG